MATLVSLETLPVELIASVFAELDIESLRCASETCARLRAVASDALLNPWRDPILRALTQRSPTELKHISVLSTVPRQNWIGILRYASPEFLLFDATLPNLSEDHYKTAFRKRFLPSWAKIRKSGSWREAFTKMLFSVYHRSTTNCTTSEAWTNFIIINRTGVANSTTGLSRTFDPVTLFNTLNALTSPRVDQLLIANLKYHRDNANLAHMSTSVRLVLRLADVRIVMFGILHRAPSLFRNPNADVLLHPPGVLPPESPVELLLDSLSTETTSESDEASGGSSGREASMQSSNADLVATSSHPHSSFLSFARRVRIQRARSGSSPVRPSVPLSSSPTGLSFWRTRSRDSSHSPTNSEGPSAASGRPSLMLGFMTRLFASPPSMSQDLPEEIPVEAHEAPAPNGHVGDHHRVNGIISVESHPHRQQGRNARQPIQSLRTEVTPPLPVLQYPTPHPTHSSYPNYTPPSSDDQFPESHGSDWRWFRTKHDRHTYFDENTFQVESGSADDMVWIGPVLIVAQLYPTHGPLPDSPAAESEPHDPLTFERHILQGQGQPTGRWASFGWADLWAIAPWLQERITKRVDGVGLGIE